jgi:O-antigen ligase
MAFSRTGWVSFPLALAVTAALARRNRMASLGQAFKRIGIAAFSAAMILGAMFAVDVPKRGGDLDLQFAFRLRQGWDLLADITGLFASSEAFADRFNPSEERADVWPEYLAMFKSEPLTGVGLGVAWESNSIKQEPHNLVLELISESGLIGAAAFGLLMWVIISGGGGVIGAAALTAAFLHSVTQTVLFEPTWWFAAALLMSGKIGSEAPAA